MDDDIAQSEYRVSDGGALAEVDTRAMVATFTISTAEPDLVDDRVLPEGCLRRLATYQANPVVLYNHGNSEGVPFPIGKSLSPGGELALYVTPGVDIKAKVWFSQSLPESEAIFALVNEGILCGASIGMKTFGWTDPDGGNTISDWQLIEWSVLPTPANPQAVLVRSLLARGSVGGVKLPVTIQKALRPIADLAPHTVRSGWSGTKVKSLHWSAWVCNPGGGFVRIVEGLESAAVAKGVVQRLRERGVDDVAGVPLAGVRLYAKDHVLPLVAKSNAMNGPRAQPDTALDPEEQLQVQSATFPRDPFTKEEQVVAWCHDHDLDPEGLEVEMLTDGWHIKFFDDEDRIGATKEAESENGVTLVLCRRKLSSLAEDQANG